MDQDQLRLTSMKHENACKSTVIIMFDNPGRQSGHICMSLVPVKHWAKGRNWWELKQADETFCRRGQYRWSQGQKKNGKKDDWMSQGRNEFFVCNIVTFPLSYRVSNHHLYKLAWIQELKRLKYLTLYVDENYWHASKPTNIMFIYCIYWLYSYHVVHLDKEALYLSASYKLYDIIYFIAILHTCFVG